LIEKNKILEDKMRVLEIEVSNLKEYSGCNTTNEEDACEVRMLKGEITNLRSKVSKEKEKSAKAE